MDAQFSILNINPLLTLGKIGRLHTGNSPQERLRQRGVWAATGLDFRSVALAKPAVGTAFAPAKRLLLLALSLP
jgi:hypothetical protein